MINTNLEIKKELKTLTRWFDHDVFQRIMLFPESFQPDIEFFKIFCKNIRRVHEIMCELQNESRETVNKQVVELLLAVKGITCLKLNDNRVFCGMKTLCSLTIEAFTESTFIPNGIPEYIPDNEDYEEDDIEYIYNFTNDEPNDVLKKAYNFYCEVFM